MKSGFGQNGIDFTKTYRVNFEGKIVSRTAVLHFQKFYIEMTRKKHVGNLKQK